MPINRVQVIWSGTPVVGGGLSTFYFDSTVGTAAQQVAAVGTFLTSTDDRRVPACAWATNADVATLDTATGALTAITTTTPATGVGTGAGDGMPPLCQGLVRLITAGIVNGRLLRGRLFMPGSLESDNGSSGSPSATFQTDYNNAGAALVADANTTWVVWSHTHGFTAAVTNVSTWNRWAGLRSRRD